MAADVRQIDDIVPLVEELRVTDFEASERCSNLAYQRGAFGHLEQDGCERDRTEAFDAIALADHTRLAQAIEATGVATERILSATYSVAGDLETAWFVLDDPSFPDFWEYLYDPSGLVPKPAVRGQRDFTRIDDDWWFVLSPDD
jgi:hypothetical protein